MTLKILSKFKFHGSLKLLLKAALEVLVTPLILVRVTEARKMQQMIANSVTAKLQLPTNTTKAIQLNSSTSKIVNTQLILKQLEKNAR